MAPQAIIYCTYTVSDTQNIYCYELIIYHHEKQNKSVLHQIFIKFARLPTAASSCVYAIDKTYDMCYRLLQLVAEN